MDDFAPPAFRQQLLTRYPALDADPALLTLLCHSLFSPVVDVDSGRVLIPRSYLAKLEGKEQSLKNNRYTALTYLKGLQAVLGPDVLSWSDYRYCEGRCREVIVQLPADLDAALYSKDAEENTKLVSLLTGELPSKAVIKRRRREMEEEAAAASRGAHPAQQAILSYYRDLPTNGFQIIKERVPEALECIQNLEGLTDEARKQQIRAVEAIGRQPVPIYGLGANGRTDRIYARGHSLQGVKREARVILTRDWYEVDIRNAHLAIMAKLWGIPELEDFLRSEGSIWPTMLELLGVNPDDDIGQRVKKACKKALYGIANMQSVKNCKAELAESLGDLVRRPSDFFKHRMIKHILTARDRHSKLLWGMRHAETCFGRPIKIRNRGELRSAGAQQLQAIELKLILPVYELAAKHLREFRIMLHQHDGVSIAFRRRGDRWKQRIDEAFQKQADELDIVTSLDWKRNE